MADQIEYNGIIYRKHPHQKYFYCSQSEGKRQYSRSLHRQMWYDSNGIIPEGYHVHHKDENAFNNVIDNFELKESRWHASYHSKEKVERNPNFYIEFQKKGILAAVEWHKSDVGKEWHKQNAERTGFGKREYGTHNCDNCGKPFVKKSINARFCSNACKSAWRRKNNPDKKITTCPTCGNQFATLKYLPVKYCSKDCRPMPNPNGRKKKVHQ